MNIQSIALLCALLSGRYASAAGKSAPFFRALLSFAVSLALMLPFMHSGNAVFYLLVLLAVSLSDFLLIHRGVFTEGKRLLSTLFLVILALFPANTGLLESGYSVLMYGIGNLLQIPRPSPADVLMSLRKILIILAGFFLTTFESNYAVVFILKKSAVFPDPAHVSSGRQKQAGMGRMIGILERALLYILIISGNLPVIGFVIAAKALARFKEMEDKSFAEYFLVGTLTSVTITILVSFSVKYCIG